MINLSRKNQPDYMFKLNLALVCFFALWFTAVVAVMIIIGCLYGESLITYGVMIGGFAVFFIGLLVFYILDIKFYNRFIRERTAELEREFTEIPFEEAERNLKDRGIITDTGFVVSDGLFGDKVVPFDRSLLFVNISTVKEVEMNIVLYAAGGDGPETKYPLDRDTFNYLSGKDTNLSGNNTLNLLKENKEEFVRTVSVFKRIFSWKFSVYAMNG